MVTRLQTVGVEELCRGDSVTLAQDWVITRVQGFAETVGHQN